MNTPDVWIAKDDGSDIVRATAIVGVGIDYNGNVTARLGHGEGATVTLADQGRQYGVRPRLFSPGADADHRPVVGRVRGVPGPAGPR